jgi:hypothetical protein
MKMIIAFTAIAFTFGCANHINPKNLPHMDAYSPNETAPRKEIKQEEWIETFNKHGGAIFEFKEGDIIDFTINVKGDVLESIDGKRAKLKKDVYFYGGKGGPMVSFDGKHFEPVEKMFPNFSFSLVLDDQTRANNFTFDATTRSSAR